MGPTPRDQILAFRISSHNLGKRLGPRSLVKAAAACGNQETPLGSAALSLCARVADLTPPALDRALIRDRTLVHLWGLRGAPYMVPAQDLAVFTFGAMPVDRASFNVFLGGWARSIEAARLDPFELLDGMAYAARTLLNSRNRDVNELRDAILSRVRPLSLVKRPKGASHDMPEPLYRAIGLAGAACIVTGRGTDAVLAGTDSWLGRKTPEPNVPRARAELVRRFLHCYGPSTPQRFADWTARSLRDAKAAFSLVADEVVEIGSAKGREWLLRSDVKTFESPPDPSGVRLLPAQDPFLQQRDRATLVQDDAVRKRLWRPVRGPGAVLADGEIVGLWRARISGTRLRVTVEPLARLSRRVRDQIGDEAKRHAPLRGCDAVELEYPNGA